MKKSNWIKCLFKNYESTFKIKYLEFIIYDYLPKNPEA